ncbi:MAG: galactose-1-phosphate uridylyltransferase [Candidatus Schekmanbacteria bacterium]|nr:galactose-1-phosphate uridylyltransferase [Candidatus Schekmanbacteria bacterium]
MPELRKDPIIGRWVIIATERSKRPTDFALAADTKKGGFCPFCSGNEDKTPPEIMAYREKGTKPNTAGWHTRVVNNKFPALLDEGKLIRTGDGIYDKIAGIGTHEVIIETPNHELSIATLPINKVRLLVSCYRERVLHLKKDKRFKYAMIFKNHGESAGASLEHPHTQLIALPIIPKLVREEQFGAQKYFDYKERCIFCDIARQEMERGIRMIEENDSFLTMVPFAPRFPFELCIVPKRHMAAFESITDTELSDLAEILKHALMRLDITLKNPSYNFVMHTSPFGDSESESFHWHIEIMPKLTKVAGFEWGTGFYINPVLPEVAATFLRECILETPRYEQADLIDIQ